MIRRIVYDMGQLYDMSCLQRPSVILLEISHLDLFTSRPWLLCVVMAELDSCA